LKRIFALIIILSMTGLLFEMPVYSEAPVSIIVSYKTKDDNIKNGIRKNLLKSSRKQRKIRGGYEVIDFASRSEAEQAIADLKKDKNVDKAEINHTRNLMGVAPDDPLFPYQWGLTYADVLTAWEASVYNHNQVVVAVLDTGVNVNHSELSGRLLTGYNAVDESSDVTDNDGHGTFVTGIIAALWNNSRQIAGVTGPFDVKVLPVKVEDSAGKIYLAYLIDAIYYAIEQGVDVINMSLGGAHYSTVEREAIEAAKAAGITLVAAAGNDGNSTVYYPASYEGVISVGSHDADGQKSDFSNYNEFVDIVAPGSNIRSLSVDESQYGIGGGTSYSSPFVAGIAAMIKALDPSKGYQDIYDILINSAKKPPGQTGRTDEYGYGYADAAAALRSTLSIDYDAHVSLNFDKVHLTEQIPSFNLSADVAGTYTGDLIWYKQGDHVLTCGPSTSNYTVQKATGTGSIDVIAKIPLSENFVKCELSWDSSAPTASLDLALSSVEITGGTLMGEFDSNKKTYLINIESPDEMPCLDVVLSSPGIAYFIKNAEAADTQSTVMLADMQSEVIYTFTPAVLEQGLYPYIVEDDADTTFAVTAYKSSGEDYSFFMICSVYNTMQRTLENMVILPVFVTDGYITEKTSFPVYPGQHVKVMMIKDYTSLTPLCEVMQYQ
jgi:hypothetical protein